ncbi:DNA-binding protein H-NS [Burkholderia sp. Ch1-1]|nr:DNA-binding protein H-NS [Burkholderia sp. Ch1-1]
MKGETYRNLTAELHSLDRKIEREHARERSNVLQRIRELMTAWDIQSNELRRYRRGTYNTKPVVPKYRDPVSGKTWSGRGHAPAWIVGKDRTAFLIDKPPPEQTDD